MSSNTCEILYEDGELCLREGDSLNGYPVTGRAGGGTFCVVLECELRERCVAIKVPRQRYTAEKDIRAVATEERILSLLNQNYAEAPIITQLETFEHEGRRCMVLERAHGTLWDFLWQEWPVLKRQLFDIAVGLAVLEDAGVVHADLKPCNILMVDGRPKLADFNSSKWLESSGRYYGDIGTLRYMAPETLLSGVLAANSDVWSYGCIVAAVLWGDDVFGQNSHADVVGAIVDLLGQPPVGSGVRDFFLNLSRDDIRAYGSGYCWSLDELVASSVVDERDQEHVVDLLSQVFQWSPENRPSPKQLLEHPLFHGMSVPVEFSKAAMKAQRARAIEPLMEYWQADHQGWNGNECCQWDSATDSGERWGLDWNREHEYATEEEASRAADGNELDHTMRMPAGTHRHETEKNGSNLMGCNGHWDHVNRVLEGAPFSEPGTSTDREQAEEHGFCDHGGGCEIHGDSEEMSEEESLSGGFSTAGTETIEASDVQSFTVHEAESQACVEEAKIGTGASHFAMQHTLVDVWCYFWNGTPACRR